jgi:hypothetical protein
MAEIDFSKLLPQMLAAAEGVLNNKWPDVKGYAESEFNKLNETFRFIGLEVAEGRMTMDRAKQHLAMQKRAAVQILLAVKGLGQLAAEAAINAALNVVKDAVNAAVGFPLI